MNMLVRTPQPQPTESLLGYVLRVSEANGYNAPTRMLTSARAAGQNGKNLGISLEKLSALVGCDISKLQSIANNTENSQHLLLSGEPVSGKFGRNPLRLTKPALCPQCVEESGYIDAVWDFALLAGCAKHRRAVIRHCHACMSPLSYHRPGILTCNCGANLADGPTNPLPPHIADLTEVIFAKAHGKSLASISNTRNLPLSHLETLSLIEFSELLAVLNRQAAFLITGRLDDSALLAERVSSILCDWPRGLHRFLHSIDEKYGAPTSSSKEPLSRFKYFYAPMFWRAKKFKFIHDEFIRFNNQEDGPEQWVSQQYLCKRWGVHPYAVKGLLDYGGIPFRAIKGDGKNSYLINIANFEPAITFSPKVICREEAILLSGIPGSILCRLRKQRILKVSGSMLKDGPYWVHDLESFHDSMIAATTAISEEECTATPSITLGEILSKRNPATTDKKVEFVAAYLAGQLHAIGQTDGTVTSIRFDTKMARNLGHYLRTSRTLSKG